MASLSCSKLMRQASSSARSRMVVRASTAVPTQFTSFTPVGDRVLVKCQKEVSKSIGGVLLPTSQQTKSTNGSVVSVGKAETVKVGDSVVFAKYAGTEIAMGSTEHVLLKEEDVIGMLKLGESITKLQPLSDRILIKTAKAENKSSGGILLTTEPTDKPNFGTVAAVGPGKKDENGKVNAPNVAVGSTVMYSKYSGTEFEDGDDEYIVVRESDILAALA